MKDKKMNARQIIKPAAAGLLLGAVVGYGIYIKTIFDIVEGAITHNLKPVIEEKKNELKAVDCLIANRPAPECHALLNTKTHN